MSRAQLLPTHNSPCNDAVGPRRVVDEREAWRQRISPPGRSVVFVDAPVIKIRQGLVAHRPVYVVDGNQPRRERDVLGMWAGAGRQGVSSGWPPHRAA
ncbi:transposase [Micromonospora sp. NBC_01699]|uniref:transposase n=1 Tax=Micromonospora sp. NBC_01699 TaxID=2975984 RepID=UPI003FA568CE